MPELQDNQDELNRKCLKFLKDLKVRPDSTQLYCLQLMQWGLDSGVANYRDSRFRNTLEHLLGGDQAESYRFLRLAEDNQEYEAVDDPLTSLKTPEDMALALLDNLDSKVSLHLPDYPKARVLD